MILRESETQYESVSSQVNGARTGVALPTGATRGAGCSLSGVGRATFNFPVPGNLSLSSTSFHSHAPPFTHLGSNPARGLSTLRDVSPQASQT